jgi:hypothetical protein
MGARINLFVGWYLVLQIFLNNVLAEFGIGLLSMLGMPESLADRFGLAGRCLVLGRHIVGGARVLQRTTARHRQSCRQGLQIGTCANYRQQFLCDWRLRIAFLYSRYSKSSA